MLRVEQQEWRAAVVWEVGDPSDTYGRILVNCCSDNLGSDHMSPKPVSPGKVVEKGQNSEVCWLLLDIFSKLL